MSDDEKNEKTEQNEKKADHEPPAGAETSASWGRGRGAIKYTATAKWTVLRKKEKPAAEVFSVSYIAGDGDQDNHYRAWGHVGHVTFDSYRRARCSG